MELIKRTFYLYVFISILNTCNFRDPVIQKGWELNRQGIELLQTNPEKALNKFLAAQKLIPEIPDFPANAGLAYMNLSKDKEALEKFSEAIKVDPDYFKAYYNQGNIFEKLGNHIRAIESYKKALQIAPDMPEIIYSLAQAYENSGNKKLAIENYTYFIEIARTSVETDISQAKKKIETLSEEERQ
ncbi:tetratricopeptide repeat protein [Leptospira fainei serovar Hurstbridge str. BUT 6]|uniref:Tetratricopeptide repeat protein n=1 Tax=Leptospira fainei serovar Hurstbridge str. BUT 6 TaxID=1193011 RepID=S3V2H6_9LEPT|nr:tetratricopeptide repeat protein [Leptospira fainei]EPG74844.1 tetratricopeptide repeat protein [Leptospira fainei serovar Hurstbridge str. BUT 6]